MTDCSAQRIRVIDSHTGGEPTRVVVEGGPELTGTLAERVIALRDRHDSFRSTVVNEPRGSNVLVGALLTPATDATCAAGLIFFNSAGYLGMCGHGTIGAIVTLAWLGRLTEGEHRIETPVGIVTATLHDPNTVSVRNVPAYRHLHRVCVEIGGHGPVTGDVAWGGNWFFISEDHGQSLDYRQVGALTEFAERVRQGLLRARITGADRAEIDHIELSSGARNFVLCPGGAYDRSPCGTGTSAKLACLAADGRLASGEVWRQESITGSVFEGRYELAGGRLIPTITGNAWVNAEATLIVDPADPHRHGICVAPAAATTAATRPRPE